MLVTCWQRHQEPTHLLGILFMRCWCTCCQRHQESTHVLGIMFRQCWLFAGKDIMNQHICQISCLGDAGYLLPKTKGINTSIMYHLQVMLVTCCQRHKESTHLLCVLFRRCWLLTAKDIWNQHIYQVSYLGDAGYLLPRTSGINTSIRYPVQAMLVSCCQRHMESTHLLGILFRRCWLLAAKDIRNQHNYYVSSLCDTGYLLPKT